jgi:2-keto-3-deoxy-L-rhamnonate aldolase RhmA
MLIMEKSIKEKLKNGEVVIGTWSIISSPTLTEIMGLSGLDFQIFDMEHGVYNIESLENSVRACELSECYPLVRVPNEYTSILQPILDIGVHGVIFPQVKDKKSVVTAVESTKFFPSGVRGYNPFTRVASYKKPISNKTGKLNNGFGLTSIIVETLDSYENLNKIVEVEDLDLVYLGVYDMSIALGCEGDVSHPKVQDFVRNSIDIVKTAGKSVGLMVMNKDDINRAIDMGATFLVYAVDSFIVHSSIKTITEELRQVLNK